MSTLIEIAILAGIYVWIILGTVGLFFVMGWIG